MKEKNNAKLAVTLYSFTKEFYEGAYTLEDCIAKAVEVGAEGIEIVNTQHIEGFPNPSSDFIDYFNGLVEKYQVNPVSYGTYTDTGIRTGGKLSLEEMQEQLLVDLDLAEKLHFPLVRVGPNTPIAVLENVLPEAEKRKIKLGVEIHAPLSVSGPLMQAMIRRLEELDSEWLGLVPDFSCFAQTVPKVLVQKAIDLGVPQQAADFIANAYGAGVSIDQLKEEAHMKGFSAEFDELIDLFYHLVVRGTPEDLKSIMPYVNHVHAKFWSLDENDDEVSVPYKELMETIAAFGYQGYISSEYEGYDVDKTYRGFDTVKRHQGMMKRYLGFES